MKKHKKKETHIHIAKVLYLEILGESEQRVFAKSQEKGKCSMVVIRLKVDGLGGGGGVVE